MNITVNGKSKELSETASIESLLNMLTLDAGNVAVELNQQIIKQSAFPETLLKNGDKIEIVHFVGGG